MSKSTSRSPHPTTTAPGISLPRTVGAGLLAVLGIAWMVVYINVAQDGQKLTWMGDLGRWNFLIGFGLVFLALAIAAHPKRAACRPLRQLAACTPAEPPLRLTASASLPRSTAMSGPVG